MLDELVVENLGLIETARLEPGDGLVVVTGETGTGKTMLLGALRLLMGAAARKDLIGPLRDEATVQARFVLDDGEVLVARRLSRSGRSKAYLDGLMAPLKALEDRTSGAVELVAQHDHLRLTRSSEVREFLDAELDDAGRAALVEYRDAWQALEALRTRQSALGGDRRALERELEMVRFQAGEIRTAGFVPGDDTELDLAAQRMRNAHAIVEALDAAATALSDEGAGSGVDDAVTALQRASRLDPTLEQVAAQAGDVASLLAELRTAIVAAADDVVAEPRELDAVEQRLALLAELRRKYGATLDEVLAFADEAATRADDLASLLADADSLVALVSAGEQRVVAAAGELTSARRQAGERLATIALEHLQELGFTDPVLLFDVEPVPAGPHGADRCTLRFASDGQLEAGAVGRIASGGELSRLVLALRLAATAHDATVAAFDEIDAGVGGAVALALGRKLARLAAHRQVLCVTHLPQVAAQADTHYVVRREGNRAVVAQVTGDERVAELTRMLSGMPESERGRRHAAELLAAASGGEA